MFAPRAPAPIGRSPGAVVQIVLPLGDADRSLNDVIATFTLFRRLLIIGVGLTVMAGCAGPSSTTPLGSATNARAKADENPEHKLHRGMTREQVRAAIGAPDETRPESLAADEAEIWVYRRKKDVVVQKAIGTQDIPYVDPFTGQTRMVPEPVYAMETTTVRLDLTLFWQNGVLERWKTETTGSRAYHQ